MRIAVIGASGRIGTAVITQLAQQHRDWQISGVVTRRCPDSVGVYRPVQWHGIDIADPRAYPRLCTVFAGVDVVVHLRWPVYPARDDEDVAHTGFNGLAVVCHAARHAQVRHLIYLSSAATYNPATNKLPVDEAWPRRGIRSSAYSRYRAKAEALLDDYEATDEGGGPMSITRLRPGVIVAGAAETETIGFGLPSWLSPRLLAQLPLIPIDRALAVPVVHADDVADAVVRVLERDVDGAFNLAADRAVRSGDVAAAFGARPLHVPAGVLGGLVDMGRRAGIHSVQRGWFDLAHAMPPLNCDRARRLLDWSPSRSVTTAFADLVCRLDPPAPARTGGAPPPLRLAKSSDRPEA